MTAEQRRICELEMQVRQLQSDNALLKSVGLLCPGTAVTTNWLPSGRGGLPSNNCAWRWALAAQAITQRVLGRRSPKPCAMTACISKQPLLPAAVRPGSRRLQAALCAQGLVIGRCRCRSLMQAHGLHAQWRRKFAHTTDSKHALAVADNVLDSQFTVQQANQVWVCDITYIRTANGWLYLAAVLDLYSRRIVGWAMAASMRAALVCKALQMAITSRYPAPAICRIPTGAASTLAMNTASYLTSMAW